MSITFEKCRAKIEGADVVMLVWGSLRFTLYLGYWGEPERAPH